MFRPSIILLSVSSILFAQPRLIKSPIQDTQRTRMTGHVHPLATAANDMGEVDPGTTLTSISLAFRPTAAQQADLESFLASQQDPASPAYHRWLTPEQYGERFGASSDDIAKVTAWLAQHNLSVTAVARARNSIAFTGTAGDVEQAFQTALHRFNVNGRNHFANTAEPSLPTALQPAVRGIHGLNDFLMKPRSVLRKKLEPNYTSASGNHYLSPDDYGTLYNIKALWNAGFDGTGQKIAVAGQTRVDLADIDKFRAKFQLNALDPQLILVPNTVDPGVSKDDLGEADLDLEWAGATAPQASILYVYSNDVMDAVQYVIDQNLAPVLSVSYGLCEPQTPKSDMLLMQSWARQANAQGITWINASGDSGGADCVTGTSGNGAGLAVDSPADIPEVTGIGGTTFNEASGQYWNSATAANGGSVLSYIPETVWNDSAPGDPASGGGGASSFFTQPRWQTGLGVPTNGARNVPDISLAASAEHDGYLVYSSGVLSVYGGTSAGTPAFAGITALLNQYLVATGAQSAPGVGNMNPRLYALAQAGTGAFHDVTAGNNNITVTCGARARNCIPGTYGFPAGQGYDQASGLGSIDAYNLVTSWHTGTAGTRTVSSVALEATTTTVISTGSVNLTATVTSAGSATPTGTVAFSSAGKQIAVAALTGTDSTATATVTVNAAQLQVGANNIVAQYSGDATLNSATATISVSVTTPAASGAPAISGLGHGASFQPVFAPGMVLSIFGSNLANGTWTAATLPLPLQTSGISVSINGVGAPLYYASSTQLNVQIPYETPVNRSVVLTVNNNGVTTSTTFTVGAAAPGLFTDSKGGAVVFGTAVRGGVIAAYLTGAGAVSPAIATGAAPAAGTAVGQLPVPTQAYSATIGGIAAPIEFIGIPSGLVGVTQVNVAIPSSVAAGAQSLIVTIGGVASPAATVTITN